MCGAITIPYDETLKDYLLQFYSADEIDRFSKNGEIIFAFWQKHPALPIRDGNGIQVVAWGNRDDALKLPKTGWARIESIIENKWKHLNPTPVLIPASRGCEKKHWFNLQEDIQGILIHYKDQKRVYMLTQAASPDYKEPTQHDRMPVMGRNIDK